MLHFEGHIDFPQAPADLFARLNDARFLVACLPDVVSTSADQADATSAACVVRPGFSFVRGTLELSLRIVEAQAPTLLRIHTHGKGIGSSNDVESVLSFAAHESGTRIHWTADVTNLGGLLKMVPQGLLKGAAQKVIEDVWTSIKAKVSS